MKSIYGDNSSAYEAQNCNNCCVSFVDEKYKGESKMKCENCPAHYDYEIADTGDYDYGCMLGSDPELTYCCRKKEHIEKKLEKQSEAWNDFHEGWMRNND